MKTIIANIAEWKSIVLEERLEQLRNRAQARHQPARALIGNKISPLDLYLYLKVRFGPPNGMQMHLRHPSTDNLIHWHYTIGSDSAVIEIWQSNLDTEIVVEGIDQPTEQDWGHFISAIKTDFRSYGPKMSEEKKKLERWFLFVNPYKRLLDVLTRCRDELSSLKIEETHVPETPKTPDELAKIGDTFREQNERFDKALQLGLTIRMFSPVLAESFINFVIFALVKPDIRQDKRLYDNVLRREIDVKVKEIHLHCRGFSRPVDTDS